MASKKGSTKKRRADSDESAQRDDSQQRATSDRTGQPLEGQVEAVKSFVSRVNWGRVALIAAGVAATVVAVRVVGPKRIVKGVGSLGVAHLAEKNAHKLSSLAQSLFARIWPAVTRSAATVIRPPQALLSRLH